MSQDAVLPLKGTTSQKHGNSVNKTPIETDINERRQRLKALDKSSVLERAAQPKSRSSASNKENDIVERWTYIGRNSRNYAGRTSNFSVSPKISTPLSLNSTADDSVFYSMQHEEVLLTARGLCRDYICYRLKRSGFRGRVVITKYAPAKDQNLSFDVLKIGKTFEELYPHLFRNLARQLGYVLRSDNELRVLFERLGSEVMGNDPEEYRWGRILALLGIAGSLSVDCIAQGHVELVENIVTIFCDFVEVNLMNWIIEHGGWDGMAKVFSIKEERPSNGLRLICRGSSVIAAGLATIVIAGIVFTMGTVTRTFSLHETSL